ncbi:unnamed protein product [Paramecium pentaurelia]|uniref:Uncharacterized protein n=1 Tax=Paramecium pentaurelia TaxID=43138 RepID=A0A8S1UCB6_9CILI|nr:unnamed protein product [Paramecium pentaurelia]
MYSITQFKNFQQLSFYHKQLAVNKNNYQSLSKFHFMQSNQLKRIEHLTISHLFYSIRSLR